MELLWFWIALVLQISDVIHSVLVWGIFNNFYIILGGIICNCVDTKWKAWLTHELLEAAFHFFILSIVFLNLEIGVLAAFIHLMIDICHTLFFSNLKMNEIEHRALHFVIESLFFMAIYSI